MSSEQQILGGRTICRKSILSPAVNKESCWPKVTGSGDWLSNSSSHTPFSSLCGTIVNGATELDKSLPWKWHLADMTLGWAHSTNHTFDQSSTHQILEIVKLQKAVERKTKYGRDTMGVPVSVSASTTVIKRYQMKFLDMLFSCLWEQNSYFYSLEKIQK